VCLRCNRRTPYRSSSRRTVTGATPSSVVIGALFFVTGVLLERRGTSEIGRLGGHRRLQPRSAGSCPGASRADHHAAITPAHPY
jgi:hypothetical protein